MRVLLLIEGLGGGGKERRLVELLKGLSKESNVDLHLVIVKNKIDYPEIFSLPITIHRIYGFSNASLVSRYNMLFKELQPDVVHAWSFKTSFYASILKPFHNFKFVAGFISDTFGLSAANRLLSNLLIYRVADVIVSNSKAGLEAYRAPARKSRVVHNGFDPGRISSATGSSLELIGVVTPLTVVMLANVTPFKDYALFVEIAEKLISKRDDVTFISIGSILPEFEDMVFPYTENKHPRIKFLGFRNDVAELIKDCDIGLLCTYTEGISNAVIELMANGLPVVTNDINGGTKEVIISGYNGVISESSELLSRLEYLLNNRDETERLSKHARETIISSFTLDAMCRNYLDIYAE